MAVKSLSWPVSDRSITNWSPSKTSSNPTSAIFHFSTTEPSSAGVAVSHCGPWSIATLPTSNVTSPSSFRGASSGTTLVHDAETTLAFTFKSWCAS